MGREMRGRREGRGEGSSGPEPGAPLSRYEPQLWLPAGSHSTALCLSFPAYMGEPTEGVAVKMKVWDGMGKDRWV